MKKYTVYMTKKAGLLIAFLFFVAQVVGQATSVPVINQRKEYQLKSRNRNVIYQLFVSLPKGYADNESKTYPVLYLLDGNYTFPIAHSARQLLDLSGSLEEVIIVGLGYAWERSYEPWYTERWKDFTPTADITSDTSHAFLALLNLKPGSLNSGGAKQFIDILKGEIIPFVEDKFRCNSDRGIAGHSLGGLFSAYSLFEEPGLFTRYGINSPSLWWENDKIFEIERSFAGRGKHINAQVFITVGSREGSAMVPKMKAFADSLRNHNYSGLTLFTQIFEDENHFSVVPASISKTLRVLYSIKRK